MFSKRNKRIFIATASIIVASICALVVASPYIRQNPTSFLSFSLNWLHIRVFEPSYTEIKDGRQLIEGFKSYESTEEVIKYLQSQNLISEWASLPGDKNLLHGSSAILVKPYTDLGHSGQLWLTFLNNRLVKVGFYPDEIQSYLTSLEKNRNIFLRKTSGFKLSPDVTVKVDFALQSRRPFVGWTDDRLDEEKTAWRMRQLGVESTFVYHMPCARGFSGTQVIP
jgi:hypothetical protein